MATEVDSVIATCRQFVGLEEEEKILTPELFPRLLEACKERKDRLRKEIAIKLGGKDQKANQEIKTTLKWSKAMEMDLKDVVLSLKKDQRKPKHIYKVLCKIYPRMKQANVRNKLKTWKPKNKDLFEK